MNKPQGASGYLSSLNGLKTLSPGRRKSRSLPITIVSPRRLAVAAMWLSSAGWAMTTTLV
jgi:hypothetical protein